MVQTMPSEYGVAAPAPSRHDSTKKQRLSVHVARDGGNSANLAPRFSSGDGRQNSDGTNQG